MNCIIIHGCPSSPEGLLNFEVDKHWIPWTRQQLIAAGIPTDVPEMPEPWQPTYEKFATEFAKYAVDENSVLIGHSCGCAFVVRWLGETKRKIAKLILVAPWKIPDTGDVGREAFYTYPIDTTITDRVGKIVMFTADNEESDGKKSLQMFHDALGGKVVELRGHGHYIMEDMHTDAFPELVQEVLH